MPAASEACGNGAAATVAVVAPVTESVVAAFSQTSTAVGAIVAGKLTVPGLDQPEDASHRPRRCVIPIPKSPGLGSWAACGTNHSGSVRRSRGRPVVRRCGRRSGCGAAPGNTTCR